ncbi:hypothetical protein ABZ392_33930 [Streptomyces sp. NPDC005885]|uniref:hypothetical protein n=1 Tax=Streptomyces sp. NPDC005885 TaxID=3157079 RepID=UPI00340CD59B
MNGPEHYREAERLLSEASFTGITGNPVTRDGMPVRPELQAALIARAQVHATLAAVAVQARPGAYYGEEGELREQRAWEQAIRPATKSSTTDEEN